MEKLTIIHIVGEKVVKNGQEVGPEEAQDIRARFEHDQAMYAQIMSSTKLRRLELPELSIHGTGISVS